MLTPAPAPAARWSASRARCGALLLAIVSTATTAQTITPANDLSFGSFVASNGGTISVTVGNGRSTSGGVIAVQQGAAVTPAQFRVSGTGGASVAITLPADNVVVLNDGQSHTMSLRSFVSSPSGTGTLDGTGKTVVRVGATLVVGNAQAPGAYFGTFPVTVNYN
jgi:hypothetical protein